jgi:long-subunit fatty acid transport protein
MNKLKWSLLLAPIVAMGSGSLLAQERPPETTSGSLSITADATISGLPLDLGPPGARALGLGGAFTAVADDSTAALANPAGLTNLTAPEVSVYVRYTDADVNYLDPDAYNSALNALAGQTGKQYSDSSTDVSFASFVIPMEGVVFSGFYSNQLNFKGVQEQSDIYMDDIVRQDPGFPDYQNLDQYQNTNALNAKVENIGLSAAFRLTDQFSLGVTVRSSSLDLSSQDTWKLDWWNDWETLMADEFYGPGNADGYATIDQVQQFLPVVNDIYSYNTSTDDKQTDLMLDVGLYYKGDQWSFGTVYHAGSEFTFATQGTLSSQFSCNATNDGRSDVCQGYVDLLDSVGVTDELYPNSLVNSDVVVKLPAVFSLGTAFRPSDTWLISFDANRVKYSSLNGPRTNSLGFNLNINKSATSGEYYDPSIPPTNITEPIEDKWTFHLGAEKSFFFDSGVLRNLSVRGGAFTVEDHDGIVATDNDDVVWTVGLGSIWGKNEIGAKLFQVDLGASFADDVTNVVLSGIFRF